MEEFSDDQIIVALASDENFFPGLYVTVTSILLSTKTKKEIFFHIIDTGITDESWNKMVKTIQKLNPHSHLVRININSHKAFDGLPLFRGNLHTHLRILLPELIKAKQFIYLDSDIIFGKDIEELWQIDFEDKTIIAVGDFEPPSHYHHSLHKLKTSTMDIDGRINETLLLCDLYNIPRNAKYFCASLLKINVQTWKDQKINEKYFEFAKLHKGQFRSSNQTPLNFTLWDKTKFISGDFNLFQSYLPLNDPHKTVIHFASEIKPWTYKRNLGWSIPVYHQIYHEFLTRLNLNNENIFKKSTIKIWIKYITRKYASCIWIFYNKTRKIIFNFFKNSPKKEEAEKAYANSVNHTFFNTDPQLIEAQNIFRNGWLEKLKRLDKI